MMNYKNGGKVGTLLFRFVRNGKILMTDESFALVLTMWHCSGLPIKDTLKAWAFDGWVSPEIRAHRQHLVRGLL